MKLINNITTRSLLSMALAILLAGSIFGQKTDEAKRTDETKRANVDFANLQAVNWQPDSFLTVGINPSNTATKLENAPVRVPFQKQITIYPTGLGYKIVAMQIPAGKRLVIDKVSVIVRCAERQRIEVNYFTYANDGTNVAKQTVQRFSLQRLGSFNETAVFAAKNRGPVIADEQIGTEHFSVGVSARLINRADGYGQAQFTFSGYLEDLPSAQ